MDNLVRGIHEFQTAAFHEHRELFEVLKHGQKPETLLITCSDSRIAPELLMQTRPGDLFVLRNAGNIVPPYGAANGGEGATIEYAIGALGVKHVIIMGHTHCGAMKGLLDPGQLDGLPLVAKWLRHAQATRHIVEECYPDLEGSYRLNAAIKENVLVQLDNLRTYPKVAALAAKGNLTVHGWIYEIEAGRVLAYDPQISRFQPLDSVAGTPGMNGRQAMRTVPAEPDFVVLPV